MSSVNFYTGSKTSYNSLQSIDKNGLYFLSNGEIYKGSVKMSSAIVNVDTLPVNGNIISNMLYLLPDGSLNLYNTNAWQTVLPPIVSSIGDSTNPNAIPNVAAVKSIVSNSMRYCGSVATYDDLEDIENPQKGDIYQVIDENNQWYIYNGTSWDEFNIGIDVSNFVTLDVYTTLPENILTNSTDVQQNTDNITVVIGSYIRSVDGKYSQNSQNTNIVIPSATDTLAGVMLPAEKQKLSQLTVYAVDGTTIKSIDGTLSVQKLPNSLTIGDKSFDGSVPITVDANDFDTYTTQEIDTKLESINNQLTWKSLGQ